MYFSWLLLYSSATSVSAYHRSSSFSFISSVTAVLLVAVPREQLVSLRVLSGALLRVLSRLWHAPPPLSSTVQLAPNVPKERNMLSNENERKKERKNKQTVFYLPSRVIQLFRLLLFRVRGVRVLRVPLRDVRVRVALSPTVPTIHLLSFSSAIFFFF